MSKRSSADTTENHTSWPSVPGSFLLGGTPLPGYGFSVYYACLYGMFFMHTIMSPMLALW